MKTIYFALFAGIAMLNVVEAAEPTDHAKSLAGAVARRKVDAGSMEWRTFQGAGGEEIRYRWMPPAKVDEGKKYPLVLCLHGAGGNSVAPAVLADDKMRQEYPCFVMYPDAAGEGWAKFAELGRLKDRKEMLPLVVEAIRSLLKTEAIDPARIYVTGQSMGGVGSWGAAARYSDLFAAAVPVCGAWDVSDAPKMTIPIWAFHGAEDGTVPVKYSRELTTAVRKAGGTAKYTEFAGVGHGSWGPAYADLELWKWLFEQRKPAAP
jgi:predicted peptidase